MLMKCIMLQQECSFAVLLQSIMEKIQSKGVSEIPNVNSAMQMNNIQNSGYSVNDRFSVKKCTLQYYRSHH